MCATLFLVVRTYEVRVSRSGLLAPWLASAGFRLFLLRSERAANVPMGRMGLKLAGD